MWTLYSQNNNTIYVASSVTDDTITYLVTHEQFIISTEIEFETKRIQPKSNKLLEWATITRGR